MFSKCRSVVLPEALRRCQMGDSSVYAVYNRLSDIVDSCTIPISELTDVLEVHLRYKVMEMEVFIHVLCKYLFFFVYEIVYFCVYFNCIKYCLDFV